MLPTHRNDAFRVATAAATTLRTTHAALPLTLDEVDAAWLTTALTDRFPGAEVTAAVRDAERAGTSTSARFTLRTQARCPAPTGPDRRAAVYANGGFDPVMRRRVWAALIQEARFYARAWSCSRTSSVETVASCVTELAAHHARFWSDPRLAAHRD